MPRRLPAIFTLALLMARAAFAQAAVAAARQARFLPAAVDGKPVKVSGFVTYDFVLK
ncbi:MAG TPA: energy transducer TonB [Pyrinomonadaceae bacterium]|nr:energy transducer TonB [Pyrinomonadaceae bacterium]